MVPSSWIMHDGSSIKSNHSKTPSSINMYIIYIYYIYMIVFTYCLYVYIWLYTIYVYMYIYIQYMYIYVLSSSYKI